MDNKDQLNTVDIPGSSAGSNNDQPNAAINSIFSNVSIQNLIAVHNNPFAGFSHLARPPFNFGSLNPSNYGFNLLNFAQQLNM